MIFIKKKKKFQGFNFLKTQIKYINIERADIKLKINNLRYIIPKFYHNLFYARKL